MSAVGTGRSGVPGLLGIDARRFDEGCVVAVAGVLDKQTCGSLANVLEWTLEHDSHRTVLDLSGLELIDRAGVRTILTAFLRASDRLDDFLIIPGSESVQWVIDSVHGPFRYITSASVSTLALARGQPGLAGGASLRGRARGTPGGLHCAKRERGIWR